MNRTLIIAAAILAGLLAIAGCNGQSQGQKIENKAQAQDTLSLETNQPVPHYNWSQYRQTIIDSETIAANGTQTTSFFFNLGVRDPIFSCPSIGVPVPNTASLTNPDQVVTQDSQGNGISGAATIGQMDPYGVYNPTASEGTFVVCVNAAGQKYLQYWEGPVSSMSAAAVWDYGTHTLKVTGAPTFVARTKKHTP